MNFSIFHRVKPWCSLKQKRFLVKRRLAQLVSLEGCWFEVEIRIRISIQRVRTGKDELLQKLDSCADKMKHYRPTPLDVTEFQKLSLSVKYLHWISWGLDSVLFHVSCRLDWNTNKGKPFILLHWPQYNICFKNVSRVSFVKLCFLGGLFLLVVSHNSQNGRTQIPELCHSVWKIYIWFTLFDFN